MPASAARQGYASATAGRLRFFQVSARGNGVGLTILRRQPAQEIGTAKESGTAQDTESEQGEKPGDSPDILLLHVLPKLWNRDWYETRVARLPRASEVGVEPGERGQLPGTLQLVIHEQQILALEPEWARSLEQVASDTLLDWDAPREAGQGDGGEALADVAPATEAPDAPDGPGTSGGSDTPDGTRTAPPETATGPNRGAQGGGVVGSDAEDGEKDPLWREVALTARLRGTLREDLPALPRADGTAGPADPVSLLWSVIDHVQGEPATGADRRDPPAGGVDLLPDLPGLEQIVYRQLLARTEDALQHRRPTFLPVTEELAFVRGRMDPQGLIRRTARRRLPVLCEFDSLSADSALWQTVRGAVQIVASEAKAPEDRERALTCDAQLRDVTVEPAHVLLASGVPPAQLQRMPVETRLAYRYARAVLARRHGVDPEESTHTAGVLVNLKYPSSVLWERLVGEYLRAALGRSEMTVTEQYRLNVFFRDPDAPGSDGEWKAVSAKRPDLVVLGPPADEPGGDGRPLLVVDAKYKRWPEDGFTGASMGDQYQLATYAYRLDVDAFLAHPVVTQPQEKSVDTLVLADPGAPALQAVGATRAERPHVGSLALPFPAPKGWSLTECTERAVRMLRDGPLEGLLRRIL
ncbi:hypothetical protein [Kocuria sp.]|uniref:5-methylcytosine restriction system specificity protein McrC n=1 Tax=Kocuria sp. TaxID=1871328 RepID=UPI0026DD82B8|nr:hypothetical protein [Kocuria sp.]MDO4918244.1 hypothetical protein [Kocuria sp.]